MAKKKINMRKPKIESLALLIVIILIQGWSVGCTPKSKVQEEGPNTTTISSHEVETFRGLAMYKTFEEFEPLLHYNNDTTYIINFWATWCKPCVAELPLFEELNAKYRASKVKVVLCSLDFPNAIETSLLPFVEKHQLESRIVVLLDGKFNRWVDRVSSDWSGAIPATYIYNNGKKEFVEKSFDNLEEIESLMNQVM